MMPGPIRDRLEDLRGRVGARRADVRRIFISSRNPGPILDRIGDLKVRAKTRISRGMMARRGTARDTDTFRSPSREETQPVIGALSTPIVGGRTAILNGITTKPTVGGA